eukprot:8667631-Karenia_brevis.AAC.1
MNKVVSSNGQIGWIGSIGRPDAAASQPQLITRCNQVVKRCKGTVVHHKVWPIKPEDIRLVALVDSSFDFKGERHQQGRIIGYTNP